MINIFPWMKCAYENKVGLLIAKGCSYVDFFFSTNWLKNIIGSIVHNINFLRTYIVCFNDIFKTFLRYYWMSIDLKGFVWDSFDLFEAVWKLFENRLGFVWKSFGVVRGALWVRFGSFGVVKARTSVSR